jgi:hypothetical protein
MLSVACASQALAAQPQIIFGKWKGVVAPGGHVQITEFSPTTMTCYVVDKNGVRLNNEIENPVSYSDVGANDILITDSIGNHIFVRINIDDTILMAFGDMVHLLTRIHQ